MSCQYDNINKLLPSSQIVVSTTANHWPSKKRCGKDTKQQTEKDLIHFVNSYIEKILTIFSKIPANKLEHNF